LRHLPDPVDVDQIAVWCTGYGFSKDDIISRMGEAVPDSIGRRGRLQAPRASLPGPHADDPLQRTAIMADAARKAGPRWLASLAGQVNRGNADDHE
jgi:hypothetical protein